MSFIPAWKDKDGNRLLVLAKNHVFEMLGAAHEMQITDCLFYIPFGWTTDGVVEIDLKDGKGSIPHVLCDGPMQSKVAVIGGPIFERITFAELGHG